MEGNSTGSPDTLKARALVAASLAMLCGAASFLPLGSLGIFADDWNTVTAMAWRPSMDLSSYAFGLAQGQARPAMALPLWLQGVMLREFGLEGAFGLAWALLAGNATLLYLLCRRQLSSAVSWLAAALFLLHPADTTHLWLITINQRFAMLVVLLALFSYCKGSVWSAGLLALFAFQIYELSPALLVLGPWLRSGGQRRDVRRTAILLAAVAAAGLLLRAPWILSAGDRRIISASAEFTGKASIETYVLWFPGSLLLGTVKWPIRALLRSAEIGWVATWALSTTAALLAAWTLRWGLAGRQSRGLRWRSRRVGVTQVLSIAAADDSWRSGVATLWGAAATMAAAGLSFAAAPNFEWDLSSRVNYFMAPGAALATAAFIQVVAQVSARLRLLATIGAICLVAAFFTFRRSVAADYRDAATSQRTVLRHVIEQLPSVPAATTVVVANFGARTPRVAVTAFTPRANWEIRGLVRALYGDSANAIPAWSAADCERWRVRARGDVSVPAAVLIDLGSGRVEWLKATSEHPLASSVPEQVRGYVGLGS